MAEKLMAEREGPSPDQVRVYATKIARIKTKLDTDRGELGALYKQLEEDGLHKPAFKTALKLKSMDPTAADEWLRHFRMYCEDFKITAQANLFDEGAEQAEKVSAEAGEAVDYSKTEAYNQGLEAGGKGQAATINPYADGSPGNAAWNSGWLTAQRKIAGGMNGANGHAADGKKKVARGKKTPAAAGRSAAAKKANETRKARKAKQADA